ncbi:PLANT INTRACELLULAR RAS-GROUP-RELATED LRR PROTEIN 3 [Salix viminalis]|uniref:PLANT INTRACELLULAR RAS-GROUP-RELATED LRR PROTEIN 3 n=1 Tax=Salix viminalis TaxID=40686 RepID=A0A9Q0SB69_SALVM|nr:PLANT INTRACELLULAR RAS-GROUP-RELATED LRR PROTEIN 3 [Salix viminalis]
MQTRERIDEEVVAILKEAESGGAVERVNLSNRQLRLIPESIGRLHGLLVLNLSQNQLECSCRFNWIAANLKFLNVSTNKVKALPESIALLQCDPHFAVLFRLIFQIIGPRSLVEIDASFNNLLSLPINIGYGLVNLERLSIQLEQDPSSSTFYLVK